MTIDLSRLEAQRVVEELQELVVPSRIQRVFESRPRAWVFQCRAPGHTHHLLIHVEDTDTRLHLVDTKPQQPPHPSPTTMLLRKWLHGAWIQSIDMAPQDRIVRLHLSAIDPQWEPTDDDDKAPRLELTLVLELLGRHPNLWLLDADDRIITTAHARSLGERSTAIGDIYQAPPPPPDWADTDRLRPVLEDTAPTGERSQALHQLFSQSKAQRQTRQTFLELRRRLRKRLKRLQRRASHIEDDLQRIDNADRFRRYGELLQSAYGQVQPGASSVTVPDFYEEGMPDVEIPLDPALDLQANIDHYFHEYRRLSDARDKVESRLLHTLELADEVQDAADELHDDMSLEQLHALKDRWQQASILPDKPSHAPSQKSRQSLPPYRQFRAKSGQPILVGRNAEANDTLTTSIARGRDVWLHARDWAGSHVILRVDKNSDPRHDDLIDAALLAAHFSKGRRDSIVDVTHTRAKYVRKSPGAPPGSVTHGGGSTLAVRTDDPRLQQLLDDERQA